MILVNEIKGKMRAKGITQDMLARELGISSKTLSSRFSRGIFGSNEIEKLIKVLDIKNPIDIFFTNDVT